MTWMLRDASRCFKMPQDASRWLGWYLERSHWTVWIRAHPYLISQFWRASPIMHSWKCVRGSMSDQTLIFLSKWNQVQAPITREHNRRFRLNLIVGFIFAANSRGAACLHNVKFTMQSVSSHRSPRRIAGCDSQSSNQSGQIIGIVRRTVFGQLVWLSKCSSKLKSCNSPQLSRRTGSTFS